MTTTVPTWAAMRAALPEDMDREILETIRRASAPVRREARIQAAWDAAYRYVDQQPHVDWGSEGSLRAAAIALCWLEARGLYGGGFQEPGAATQRHPAFEGLGSGRHQALDGRAWDDAIACAAYRHIGPDGVAWADLGGMLALRVDIAHPDWPEAAQWPDPPLVPLDVLLQDQPEALRTACLHCARDLAPPHRRTQWNQVAGALARTLATACTKLRELEQKHEEAAK
jgi:hypothetical protein